MSPQRCTRLAARCSRFSRAQRERLAVFEGNFLLAHRWSCIWAGHSRVKYRRCRLVVCAESQTHFTPPRSRATNCTETYVTARPSDCPRPQQRADGVNAKAEEIEGSVQLRPVRRLRALVSTYTRIPPRSCSVYMSRIVLINTVFEEPCGRHG
jgi:hypothetical protein